MVTGLGGVASASQSAVNAELGARMGSAPVGAIVNNIFVVAATYAAFVLGTAALLGASGAATRGGWPGEWFLYLGGLFGVMVMIGLLVGVRSVGVLRTGLAVLGGQLVGALLIDILVPGGPSTGAGLLVGAVLILLAVVVSGRGSTPRTGDAGS
ncbi:DMT family transporter [Solwaraspora sp. WMMD937]|uniref:DMT family transporter n=1 Tax=Solwaraspora sp. WMMD937 TaxID=3016090 RepID=UPI00249CE05F|nr:DMT family transporter [Solwaraspora sp. WMMD937]WFE24612.1 DMT family transporter [Solwaraspora sp. WMMD937]